MSGATLVFPEASRRDYQRTEGSGSSESSASRRGQTGSFVQWRRVALRGYGNEGSSSDPSSSTSASTAVALSSGQIAFPSAAEVPGTAASPESASPTYTVTHAANLPASLPVSSGGIASTSTAPVPGTAPLPDPASSTYGAITHGANLPASSPIDSGSKSTVPNGTGVATSPASSSTDTDETPVDPSAPSAPQSSATSFPTPAAQHPSSFESLPPDSASASSTSSVSSGPGRPGPDSSGSVLPIASTIPGTTIPGATITTRGSAIVQEPSSTIALSAFFPVDSATTPGTSVTTPVLSTTGAGTLSRTFAHNTGGIVGVALGAVFALLLGVLFTLFLCRRSKNSQKRKFSGMWISPPLLQANDGPVDAYSPVSRRRSRRGGPGYIRPLSFQSLDIPSMADTPAHADGMESDPHYDTDTWGTVPTPSTTSPVVSSPPSNVPLSPEYWLPPASDVGFLNDPLIQSQPTDEQPSIGAKGFMRRLRRGRPSLASRGLLTTLAPVPESPNSPAMSTTEISRPPSSMQGPVHSPALLSRPQNYSLPWIHRTRTDVPGWTPPSTWTAEP